MRLAWEPARYQAFVLHNLNVKKSQQLRLQQHLIRFPWEARIATDEEKKEIKKNALLFRNNVVRKKWGLKYLGDAN